MSIHCYIFIINNFLSYLLIFFKIVIKRLIATQINTVQYVSWGSTLSSTSGNPLTCKGYIYQQDSTTGITVLPFV